jgi:hypothetical protein
VNNDISGCETAMRMTWRRSSDKKDASDASIVSHLSIENEDQWYAMLSEDDLPVGGKGAGENRSARVVRRVYISARLECVSDCGGGAL